MLKLEWLQCCLYVVTVYASMCRLTQSSSLPSSLLYFSSSLYVYNMYLYTIYKQIGFDLGAQLEELQESAVHKDSALAALRQRLAATENDLKVRRETEGERAGERERERER